MPTCPRTQPKRDQNTRRRTMNTLCLLNHDSFSIDHVEFAQGNRHYPADATICGQPSPVENVVGTYRGYPGVPPVFRCPECVHKMAHSVAEGRRPLRAISGWAVWKRHWFTQKPTRAIARVKLRRASNERSKSAERAARRLYVFDNILKGSNIPGPRQKT